MAINSFIVTIYINKYSTMHSRVIDALVQYTYVYTLRFLSLLIPTQKMCTHNFYVENFSNRPNFTNEFILVPKFE